MKGQEGIPRGVQASGLETLVSKKVFSTLSIPLQCFSIFSKTGLQEPKQITTRGQSTELALERAEAAEAFCRRAVKRHRDEH